jgi:SagB-type dehydrogenase family enzyme
MVQLPAPVKDSDISIEKALIERRSIRDYKGEPLGLSELSQLLWAAQGITASGFYRAAPSAGALYPIEVYVVAGRAEGLAEGIYRYNPMKHLLTLERDGDYRRELCKAALMQDCIRYAPCSIVIAAVYERTTGKYGERGVRYVHMEVGHVAENISLQAVSLNIGTVIIGAFSDDEVKRAIGLPRGERPLCIMPLGRI